MNGYTPILGVPYAPIVATGRTGEVVRCPVCSALIVNSIIKDGDSFDGSEYADHYLQIHGKDEGLVEIDGVWYERGAE